MLGTGWKDPPSSLLSLIMDKVMFAEQIMRPMFPTDWDTVVESPINNQGDQRGGTPRTGDRLQPRGGGDQGDK